MVDEGTIRWPEYRGNGVSASMGNIVEQPQTTLLFIDWWESDSLVWVSGEAAVNESIDDADSLVDNNRRKAWVDLDVEEIRIAECPSLPTLSIESFDPPWGTDDVEAKKAGFFT